MLTSWPPYQRPQPASRLLHGCRYRQRARVEDQESQPAQDAELVARYVRTAEEWTDSGLKGVGF